MGNSKTNRFVSLFRNNLHPEMLKSTFKTDIFDIDMRGVDCPLLIYYDILRNHNPKIV